MDQADDNAIMLPIELTNTTGMNLHDLNEDCLMEIFSCKSLKRMDLCSIAETCTRFNQIARRVFPKEFGVANDEFAERYDCDADLVEPEMKNYVKFYKRQDVKRVLKNFGSRLRSLSIDRLNIDVVHSVAEYCGGVTLTRLKIVGLDSIEGLRMKLNLVFEKLLRLTIVACQLRDIYFTGDNNYCHSLTELEIVESTGCATILKHTYPNLKRFSFSDSSIYLKDNDNFDILLEFIERHKRLRALSTKIYYDRVCGSKLIGTIGKCCNELEELKFHNSINSEIPFDVSNLQRLTKLVSLDIRLDGFDTDNNTQYTALLQELKSLERLRLWSWTEIRVPVKLVDVLAQLPNLWSLEMAYLRISQFPWKLLPRLKSVHLRENYDCADDLFTVIRQLPNLESLELTEEMFDENLHWFVLSEKDFDRIVEIVKKREHLLTIKCRFNFRFKENCDKSRKVKLIKLN